MCVCVYVGVCVSVCLCYLRLCRCREYSRGKFHCTIDLLFDWFGVSCITTIFVFIFKTDESKLEKQEVNSIVILPPLVFPGICIYVCVCVCERERECVCVCVYTKIHTHRLHPDIYFWSVGHLKTLASIYHGWSLKSVTKFKEQNYDQIYREKIDFKQKNIKKTVGFQICAYFSSTSERLTRYEHLSHFLH